jgi:hypothetical protein
VPKFELYNHNDHRYLWKGPYVAPFFFFFFFFFFFSFFFKI